MFSKVTRITNIGDFKDPCWAQGTPDLKRINIVYGFNGSGKTMFSNALRLFQMGGDAKALESELRADRTKPIIVEAEWDGKPQKATEKSRKILVFNDWFISEHVYDGTASRTKLFREGVVTADQLKSPEIKKLDENLKAAEEELAGIQGTVQALVKASEGTKKRLSARWNAAISKHRLTGLGLVVGKVSSAVPAESLVDLNAKLDVHFRKYALAERTADLAADLSDLEGVVSPRVLPEVDPLSVLNKNAAQDSVRAIQEKVDRLKASVLKHASLQQWFEDGATLLKASQSLGQCPLCDSVPENIDVLLQQYAEYFNDAFATLQQEVKTLAEALREMQNSVSAVETMAATTTRVCSKYSITSRLSAESQKCLETASVREVKGALAECLKHVLAKQVDMGRLLTDAGRQSVADLSLRSVEFKVLSEAVQKAHSEAVKVLKENDFNPSAARKAAEDVFWKEFDSDWAEAHAEEGRPAGDVPGGISSYLEATKKEESAKRQVAALLKQRNELLVRLRNESKYVNDNLRALGISNMKIKLGDRDGEEIQVLYESGAVRHGLRYSLSEGERTALAFAYFISKVQFEVIENTNEQLEQYVVVIDDPISSLDENRLLATAGLIRRVFVGRVKQIFVLSHNLVFLRQFATGLSREDNNEREDLYIEAGLVQKMPAGLKNFQTSYFYKLQKIRDYVDRVTRYEDARDYLPNYIRTVLETFLAFKFGRIASSSRDRRFLAPGLADLIAKFDQVSLNEYPRQGKLSGKQDVVDLLWDLKSRTDPESHGTPQDLTEIEYLSDAELRQCSADCLLIIEFLDRVHLGRVGQMG